MCCLQKKPHSNAHVLLVNETDFFFFSKYVTRWLPMVAFNSISFGETGKEGNQYQFLHGLSWQKCVTKDATAEQVKMLETVPEKNDQ